MDLGSSSKGGKKPLDAMINLVPFIDLMAVTIVFLIMTAVWTQLGSLQVSQAGQAGTDPPPPSMPITLLITEKALQLTVGGSQLDPLPITRDPQGRIDTNPLTAKLVELKTQQPEQAAITLSSEDAVKYEDLVRLIDAVVNDGMQPLFPSVNVSPVGP
jgi:biopolymer transport protein TolR